jgi:hypothetical protein
MKAFFKRAKRGPVAGVLAASVIATVLGIPTTAHAAVFKPCSAHALRDAVNAADGDDTIKLDKKCKYVFTSGDLANDPDSALFVDVPMYIAGNGATIKIASSADLRHFTVDIAGSIPGSPGLTLNNVILKGGSQDSPYSAGGSDTLMGGSILVADGNVRGERLTVTDNSVTVIGDTADGSAGGIAVGPAGDNLALVSSTVSGNSVDAHGVEGIATGGGIMYLGGGALTVTRSTVKGNEMNASSLSLTSGVGGGIYTVGTTPLTVEDSAVTGNSVKARGLLGVAAGGGIYIPGGVGHEVNDTDVSGNKVTAEGAASLAVGGGILNGGTLATDGATINSNKATCKASGICLAAGGGYANQDLDSGPGSATFVETEFNGNKAEAKGDSGAGAGGGLAVDGGTTVLDNSTVTKNQAKGSLQLGGGIANFGPPAAVDITDSAVFLNKPSDCYGVPACG